MAFASLMRDNVSLLKRDGSRVDNLRASVQRSKIYMDAGQLVIESGDLILRRMSTGAEETYEVIDPCFYEGHGGIPPNYQMDVRKLGLPEATRAVQSITYNITGPNARINQNSIDASTNVVNVDARVAKYVADLRRAVSDLDIDEVSKQQALEVVNEVDTQVQSGKPKKSVVGALLRALPQAANVASIASALMELLS